MAPTGAVGRGTVVRVSAPAGRGEAVLAAAREAADVPVVAVGPTGIRKADPLVLATHDGRTAFVPACSPERVREVAAALEQERLPDAAHVVTHEPDAETLPLPGEGPFAVGTRRVMGGCGWVDPTAPGEFDLLTGTGSPEAALETVESIGLLGRGRGDAWTDEPIADAWRTAREAEGDPVVVVNANEADDRVAGDRLLVEGLPLPLLDTAALVAEVVGADDVVVYCNESQGTVADRVRAAVEAVRDDLPVEAEVVTGPDSYIAGEETMALESLEGNDRLEARLRPPSPAEHGLYGRPTLVHTPRTLAQVRRLLRHPDEFDPQDADPGTRLLTVSAEGVAPATVELPTGGSLDDVTEAIDFDRSLKFACVGGRFGGLTGRLSVSPSAPALAGAGLGTNGAVELFGEGTCAVALAGDRARGASEDNCGRCVPCREGSKQLTELLRDIYDGAFDDDGIRELTRVMRASSTCAFGRDAARTVGTAVETFETEFRAHAEGRCPAGTCPTER